jgi:hypothetical protein
MDDRDDPKRASPQSRKVNPVPRRVLGAELRS